ncbi:MAG: inositol monophosphatase family protein [Candidatus Heimdallarchaeota archaeon]|nr:inositol monophosphatase family protein [Candidatus Heimdallarchaeota archaeon]
MNPKELQKVAEEAARMAGSFLRLMSFKDLQVFRKGKGDVTTNFDLESERLIKNHILMHFPDHTLLAEESVGDKKLSSDSITWFIDPLDGTKAFLRGNLAFVCMSIAAWDKTGLLAGVVYNPFTDMLYATAKSRSVYLNGSVLPPPRSFPLKEARILIDFSNRLPMEVQKQLAVADLDEVIGRSYRLGGGISQHLMLVAQGTLHGALFWGAGRKGKFWDIAAAALILERLGVKMTSLEGAAIHPEDKIFDQLIIARTNLHAEMLQWVEQLKKVDS